MGERKGEERGGKGVGGGGGARGAADIVISLLVCARLDEGLDDVGVPTGRRQSHGSVPLQTHRGCKRMKTERSCKKGMKATDTARQLTHNNNRC
jgi:hypothetical protein